MSKNVLQKAAGAVGRVDPRPALAYTLAEINAAIYKLRTEAIHALVQSETLREPGIDPRQVSS